MKKIVFLTGAGMSVESGFKTFRGSDGLWENEPVEKVATHEGWEADPAFVTEFYNAMREKLFTAKPNRGHEIIREMERDFDVRVVTQNVDNLHESAGSSRVLHLHGQLDVVSSSNDPDNPRFMQTLTADNCRVEPGTRAADGSLLRPYIVFFGEAVPNMPLAEEWVHEADILVVIGSSLSVYPAANLIFCTKPSAEIFLIDPNDVAGGVPQGVKHIRKGASAGMEELRQRLSTEE